jgi:hypothetical protein
MASINDRERNSDTMPAVYSISHCLPPALAGGKQERAAGMTPFQGYDVELIR